MKQTTLRRYTNIPALIQILRNKKLTMLDPSNWDDTNDSHGLAVYKERCNLKTLLALCFTDTVETYHHWHVFAGDTSGVCIVFYKNPLLEFFKPGLGFIHGSVEYKTLHELRDNPPSTKELPYVKRQGYMDEHEYRILYKTPNKKLSAKQVTISLDCIARIVLSPWIHRSLVQPLRETIIMVSGDNRLGRFVFRSSLTGNQEWKELFENGEVTRFKS